MRPYSHTPTLFFFAMAMMLCISAMAQDPVDEISTWTGLGLDGWAHGSALVTLSRKTETANPTNGYLNLEFRQQSIPESVTDIAWREVGTGVILTNISFLFQAFNTTPSEIRVYLHSSQSGNLWYVPLPNPSVQTWMAYSVPVRFSSGWIIGAGGTEEQFLQDLEHVDWVGVYIRRAVNPMAQNYGIDDFRIRGSMGMFVDTDGDGIPDWWENLHGLNPNDSSDAILDNDDDGIDNYGEYRAGTDPNDPNSVFTIEIEIEIEQQDSRVILRWNSIENRTYSVWRSTDLFHDFVRIESGIPGVPPKNEYIDMVSTNAGRYYYRVGVE